MRKAFDGIGMTSRRTRERLVKQLREEGITHAGILETVRDVPRHIFVDEALASRAYENTALPIGYGQTISQPYIVARMTEALIGEQRPVRVLEVGTGCGYQSAVLAQLVDSVYSIERIPALYRKARERMRALRLTNVHCKMGDGTAGWPGHAPFDGIIVTAAPIGVPPALLEQLAPHGRLVIPVGSEGVQRLMLITHGEQGFDEALLDYVTFVPMLAGTASTACR